MSQPTTPAPIVLYHNLSVQNYIQILLNIERGTASVAQWAQLSKPMVSALPQRLLTQYPDGLAAAKSEHEKHTAIKRQKTHNEEWSWIFSVPGHSAQIEDAVLSFISTLHVCATPYPHACPQILKPPLKSITPGKKGPCRILAFRQLKEFTTSPLGNGSSGLRHEIDDPEEYEISKVDSLVLAGLVHDIFDNKSSRYDLEDVAVRRDEGGEVAICWDPFSDRGYVM